MNSDQPATITAATSHYAFQFHYVHANKITPEYLYTLNLTPPVTQTSDWPLYYLYDRQQVLVVTLAQLDEKRHTFTVTDKDVFKIKEKTLF
ncbi:hypothetical protein DM01DRAFT_1370375 [Hesseltinella vesiculosa]|uniref:Uncharacterized protein n=1 Tax=Hesseltinella vesiculosa TaxID=101127 RepID=A0A1X2GTM3_9FUNG|nr:hypothetical protein DM01DRAFT_1370375 [Hesseltinella vesiculosa]